MSTSVLLPAPVGPTMADGLAAFDRERDLVEREGRARLRSRTTRLSHASATA